MKRINNGDINSPSNTDEIFTTRWEGKEHDLDWPRFQALAEGYRGGKYLDIGCFNSPMPGYLAEESKLRPEDFPNAEIYAIDYGPETIRKMKAKFPDVNYICGDIFEYPFEKGSFDYIVMGEILEHMEKPQALVDRAYELLKPGGKIAASTPFEEEISQPAVSKEHLWAFTFEDMKELFSAFRNLLIKKERSGPLCFFVFGEKEA